MEDPPGIDRDHKHIIDGANPLFYSLSVVLIFFTLLNLNWYLVLLWSCAIGVLGMYLLFRNRRLAPNILLHLKPVIDVHKDDDSDNNQLKCSICDHVNCRRHPVISLAHQDYVMPWTDLDIPETIDSSITEFLNIVIEKFITNWHSNITKTKHFDNDIRVLIRHAACLFLHRVAKIDIPKLISGPLLQSLAEHMHLYLTVRRKLPTNASSQKINREVFKALGSRVHVAMRGKTANLRYFRNLTRLALPHLLTTGAANSKIMKTFLEELFPTKIMIPTMDFVATPDFLNMIVILIFDKESKLVRLPNPPSRPVSFLQKFSRQKYSSRIQIHINDILRSQKILYLFMQFLKRHHSVHVLQFYLECDELRTMIAKDGSYSNANTYLHKIDQILTIYTSSSIDQSIIIKIPEVSLLGEILQKDISDLTKIKLINEHDALNKICNYVLMLLQSIFCPLFIHSDEYYNYILPMLAAQIRRSTSTADTNSLSRHFEKWRNQRRKTVSTSRSLELISENQIDPTISLPANMLSTGGLVNSKPRSSSQSSVGSSSSSLEENVSFSLMQIQVVDYEVINAIKPYTLYTIVSRHERDGKVATATVKRRYKEFVVLDSRIHQFYRNISVHFPRKKTFHNMDKQFIETRMKDLQDYLNKVVQEPEIHNSQLLRSFLSDTDDIALFMPDSVGVQAGKIIKSVPRVLKREPKEQYLDNLLVSMEATACIPPREPSLDKLIKTDETVEENEKITKKFKQDLADDKSSQGDKAWLHPPITSGNPVTLNGVMDLLIFLAINVYDVSHFKLSVLLAIKMLAQSSVEAFFHEFINNRVELICQEHKICQLVELLQYELFFNENPRRTPEDKAIRRVKALETVLSRPPSFLIKMIGRETFINNTSILFEGLQNQELNKQMLFCMLDIVVCEIFPELKQQQQQQQ